MDDDRSFSLNIRSLPILARAGGLDLRDIMSVQPMTDPVAVGQIFYMDFEYTLPETPKFIPMLTDDQRIIDEGEEI